MKLMKVFNTITDDAPREVKDAIVDDLNHYGNDSGFLYQVGEGENMAGHTVIDEWLLSLGAGALEEVMIYHWW